MPPPPSAALPRALAATVAHKPGGSATKRPRAFGRTSNVWQYVEIVQERMTPVSQYRKSSLAEEEEEEDDDDELGFGGERVAVGALSGDALHPMPAETRKASGGGGDDRSASGKLLPMPAATRGSRSSASGAFAMKNVKSLPELVPPATTATAHKKASAGSVNVGGLAAASGGGGGYGSPAKKPFNGNDVVRRIQALGTSASVPHLPPGSVGAAGGAAPTTIGSPTALLNGPATANAIAGQAAGAAAAATAAATTATPLFEAERLRNDFNSQRGRLYFGCSVALELFNGHLLMVSSPDGAVGVQALEEMHLKSASSAGGRHRAVFTLIDLTDVRSASSIRYGDAVWLQLSVGPGETSWEQGGVLGAKVREAPQLKALALADDESIRHDAQAPLVVGHPVPVRAYLPKNRDDVDAQVDEIQSRVRNKSSKMLGKWIVRSALQRKRRPHDNFVYNTDEIYLEQDWFYLGADSDAGVAVLRQLPPAAALKEIQLGEYVVERRGAWRLRLLDSSNGSAGLSLAQQQMEKLLLRAKTQLKQSRRMRAGQAKQYAAGLRGGAAFVVRLRTQLVDTTRDCDAQYLASQERRLSQLPQHLSVRAGSLASDRLEPLDEAAFSEPRHQQQQQQQQQQKLLSSRPPSATAALATPSRSPSAVSSRGGSAGRSTDRDAGADPGGGGRAAGESVCSLCKASSIGYNLCCQIHKVMSTLHAEIEQASAALAAAKVHAQAQRALVGSTPLAGAPGGATAHPSGLGTVPEKASGTTQRRKSVVGGHHRDTVLAPPTEAHAAAATTTLSTSASAPSLASGSGSGAHGQSRMMELFSQQDQQLQDVIAFKERDAQAARVAEAHARIGLSSVATHFRDRFKHVDLLVKKHADSMDEGLAGYHQGEEEQHHGIGGHFHKLHAEIKREESQRRESQQRANRAKRHLQKLRDAGVERGRKGRDSDDDEDEEEDQALDDDDDDDDEAPLIDTTTECPVDFPGDGFDVFGNPLAAGSRARGERLFPSDSELDRLPPVDTTQALELYLHNTGAVVEMLDGFMDLSQTHILPNLAAAMGARSRGALVEFLDFAARAAEFVCARRVQVRAAQLLHAVAASAVGDFESFGGAYEALLRELESTAAFIRFYRDKATTRHTTKNKKAGA